MIKSMTGYGRGEALAENKRFTVEMRSVNHRYSEVVVRMPKFYSQLEDRVKKVIQEKIARGRIDVFIAIEETENTSKVVRVDKVLALAYYNALKELEEALAISGNYNVLDIAMLPDVLTAEEEEEDIEKLWSGLEEALEAALNQLVDMRRVEGEKLAQDMEKRVDKISAYREAIANKAPIVVEEYKEKLAARLKELLGDIKLDEARLAAEVAFFADRSNITEELVRLKSHLEQFKESLKIDEPVGRKLDFLVQELNREINTIGSKASDLEIAKMVIAVKSEIEKIREQVQNIE